MTIVTVDDLHLCEDPHARLKTASNIARVKAGTNSHQLLVRVPDKQTNGLRVFQVQDVARLLQRYGRIGEIGVTDGGTIVASVDVHDRRGEIAIWTGQAIGQWHPTDVVQRGLGGSETAAVRLAEELARMNYLVTLYGDFSDAGMCGDIMLRHYLEFDPSQPLDALVGFRHAPLFDRRPNAKFCALWLEDLAPAEHLTQRNAENIDRICTVSHFHKRQTEGAHPWLDPKKVTACRNGVHLAYFTSEPAPDRELRVIYSSSPDRGGDIVLECWPEVRKHVPNAELVLTYPRWFDLCASMFLASQGHLARIKELLEQPGVHRIEGGLGQKALANLMRSSQVWVHPSYYTPGGMKFEETSCISCMEAQAAGLVVVAANWGALSENVLHGTLLDGDPSDADGHWRKAFVAQIVRGLTDEITQSAAREVGPAMMRDVGWSGAAEQLAAMFPAKRKIV